METAQVAIVDVPPLQADLLRRQLDATVDLQVAVVSDAALEDVAEEIVRDVDVLILGSEDVDATTICTLFDLHPRLKAVAVSPTGHRGVVYQLSPEVAVVDEASPSTLVDAVRRALTVCEQKVVTARARAEDVSRRRLQTPSAGGPHA